jgi:hypothetical protein
MNNVNPAGSSLYVVMVLPDMFSGTALALPASNEHSTMAAQPCRDSRAGKRLSNEDA